MTPQEWNEGMNHLDMDLVEEYILLHEKLVRGNRTNGLWLRLGAAVACLALLAGVFFLTPRPGKEPPEHTSPSASQPTVPISPPDVLGPQPPLLFDSFAELSGSSLEFVVGSSTVIPSGGGQPDACPPTFEFQYWQFAVVARVVKNLPDIYYRLDISSDYKPTAYRLVQMEVVQTIHGENMPQKFLYILPADIYVDMSVHDLLLISMVQLGTEGYVLRNGTRNCMESCDVSVYCDYQWLPEMGNIIAFTQGVFDETLWQNSSWRYGYQVGKNNLDAPQDTSLVVRRGGTLEEAICEINRRIDADKQKAGDAYKAPTTVTLSFKTQAARDAIDLVKPFKNGVFSQQLETWSADGRLTFRRFINGCQTEETISIDLATEKVTYSDVRYTAEDRKNLQNIALYLSEQAATYAQSLPVPPHTDPEEKKLLCLNLYAWYAKVDGKNYGVVKTVWRHSKEDDWFIQYYDDQYVLFDMSANIPVPIERDDLVALLGERNVYTGPYGREEMVPL